MKRSTKSSLIAALILFSLGLLIAVIAFVSTLLTGVDLYRNDSREYDIQSFQYSLAELKQAAGFSEQQTLSELSVSLQAATVILQETDSETQINFYNVDKNNLSLDSRLGSLSISESQPINRFGFTIDGDTLSFGGLRYLFHTPSVRSGAKLVILWNPTDELPALNLNVTCGSIEIDSAPASTNIYASVNLGTTRVSNCNSPESSLDVHVVTGKIDCRNNRFDSVNCTSTVGSIRLTAAERKTTATTAFGLITLLTPSEKTDYQLRASATVGTITLLDGTTLKNQYNSPSSDASSFVSLNTTMGLIKLESFSDKT